MIEFQTVSREFRSLVTRRQELITLLGSVFAGMGIFLQNTLAGNLPPSLAPLEHHLFAFYAIVLLVTSLALALRMARMHAGMIINGVLFAKLMSDQSFTAKGDPDRAARHNYAGVSFLYFVLTDLISGFAATILVSALGGGIALAAGVGTGVVLAWLAIYFQFHHDAASFALAKCDSDARGPFTQDQWKEHISASLEDANKGLITDLGFVGLIVFSVFESLSGLGGIKARGTDFAASDVTRYGPFIYSSMMLITCLMGLVIYIRVRVAIGKFSLLLDPTDRPFRPLKLTDSLLGYIIEAFLLAVAVHVSLTLLFPDLGEMWWPLLAIDASVFALAVLAEQLTLVVAGRSMRSLAVAANQPVEARGVGGVEHESRREPDNSSGPELK